MRAHVCAIDTRIACAKRTVRLSALLVCGLLALGQARADGDHIVLLVGGIEKQIYLPVTLAEHLGYFREQGLDVDVFSEPSGVNAEDQLLAGSAQGVVGFYDHTIDLQAKGKVVEDVIQLAQTPGEALVVSVRIAAKVHGVADLKGHNVGVAGLRGSTEFLSYYLAAASGMKMADISTEPVGAGDSFLSALRQGHIDAGMTTEPTISRAIKSGDARVLVDLRTAEDSQKALGGLYPSACLYMRLAWIKAHRDEVQRLVLAFSKTLRYIQTHTADEIAANIPVEYFAGDRELYVRALASNKAMFTPDGRMPASGPDTALRVLNVVDRAVQGKQIDLAGTYTSEFLPTQP